MPGRLPANPDQLIIETAPEPKPRMRVVPNGSKHPRWTRYDASKALRPHKCDWCKLNQRDDPTAPVARFARYRRRVSGEDELLLCGPHASDQRVVDGLPRYKGF